MDWNWLEQAQQLPPLQANPDIVAAGQQSTAPVAADNFLGALAGIGNRIVPGGTDFGQGIGASQFPDAAIGMALPVPAGAVGGGLPAAVGRGLQTGRAGAATIEGTARRIPPGARPPEGQSSWIADLYRKQGMGAGGASAAPRASASGGSEAIKPVVQGPIEGARSALTQAREGVAKIGAGIIAAAGLGSLLQRDGDKAKAEEGQALQAEVDNTLERVSMPEAQQERDEIVQMALNIIRHQPVEALYSPDYEKYRTELESARDIFLNEFDTYARPEEKTDPSFWESTLRVLPAILAGGLAMGPAGALLGGLAGLSHYNEQDANTRTANRAEWRDHSERRLGGATSSLQNLAALSERQRAAGMEEGQWQRWNQLNAMEDDAFLEARKQASLGQLSSVQGIQEASNRLNAQRMLLQSMQGMPGAQAAGGAPSAESVFENPDMGISALNHILYKYNTQLGPELQNAITEALSSYALAPDKQRNLAASNIVLRNIFEQAAQGQEPFVSMARDIQALQQQGAQQQSARSLQGLAGW